LNARERMVSRMNVPGAMLYAQTVRPSSFMRMAMRTKSSRSNGARQAFIVRRVIGFTSTSAPAKSPRITGGAVRQSPSPLGFKVSHQRTDDDVFCSVKEGLG